MESFSVLLAVYHKDNPEWFQLAVDSVFEQSVVPDEVVIIVDGPVGESLEDTLTFLNNKYGPRIVVERLKSNVGLGAALNIGLGICKHEIVARMDSDDYSFPKRFELQLDLMDRFDLVGGGISEFTENIDKVISLRIPPSESKYLRRWAWLRCPFNHPTVMFRKSKVIESGGYTTMHSFEDSYLWLRVLSRTSIRVTNIQESLVAFRVSEEQYNRRRGPVYRSREIAFLRRALRENLISKWQFSFRIFISLILRSLPISFFKLITKSILRK